MSGAQGKATDSALRTSKFFGKDTVEHSLSGGVGSTGQRKQRDRRPGKSRKVWERRLVWRVNGETGSLAERGWGGGGSR